MFRTNPFLFVTAPLHRNQKSPGSRRSDRKIPLDRSLAFLPLRISRTSTYFFFFFAAEPVEDFPFVDPAFEEPFLPTFLAFSTVSL